MRKAWIAASVGVAIAVVVAAGATAFSVASAGSGSTKSGSSTNSGPTTTGPGSKTLPSGVTESTEVIYGHDGYFAPTCAGNSDALHYVVFSPTSPGPHPVVFGFAGSGFHGVSRCDAATGHDSYQRFDEVMARWAQSGFVAVNVEYHGTDNGLHGSATYPGPGKWGSMADGTTQLDIKPAVEYFESHDPAQYGAVAAAPVVLFGSSSGAHDAYMAGLTGIPGVEVAAVVGWSGLPDAAEAGSYPEGVFDSYMGQGASPGSDLENFGDPLHRLSAQAPPEYVANGLTEFISPTNAEDFSSACAAMGVTAWLRILDTSQHAQGYALYTFTGHPPETTQPPATTGSTVMEDSISFASMYTAA